MFTRIPENNHDYLQALFELEQWRADLAKVEFDKNRVQLEISKTKFEMDMVEDSLDYLRKYTKIVSIREFKSMKFQHARQYETLYTLNRTVEACQRHILRLEDGILRQETVLPTLSSKVLEFKNVKG